MDEYKIRALDILGLSLEVNRLTRYQAEFKYNGQGNKIMVTIHDAENMVDGIVIPFMEHEKYFDKAEDMLASYIYGRK